LLVVAAYVITYMDRVNISSAMPVIQRDLGLTAITVGWIFSSFRWGYALFQIPGGWFGDKFGPRRALALVVCWWSVFTSLTALCWSASSMCACRFLFGVGEAGTFPIATRSLSRWMPADERGFSQGLPHAASRLGAAVTPPSGIGTIETGRPNIEASTPQSWNLFVSPMPHPATLRM
jgi:MFS family permease